MLNPDIDITSLQSNTWLELQDKHEGDKFPNTNSPCAHLETAKTLKFNQSTKTRKRIPDNSGKKKYRAKFLPEGDR